MCKIILSQPHAVNGPGSRVDLQAVGFDRPDFLWYDHFYGPYFFWIHKFVFLRTKGTLWKIKDTLGVTKNSHDTKVLKNLFFEKSVQNSQNLGNQKNAPWDPSKHA